MPVVVVEISRTVDACWQAFTDASLFAAWMPGLRRATIVSRDPGGRPHEILFEYSTSLTYSLLYSYDLAAHEVTWEPRTGARDAVRGQARFDPCGTGTRMTYKLEQGKGRTTGDLMLGGAHQVVEAFARWIDRDAAVSR